MKMQVMISVRMKPNLLSVVEQDGTQGLRPGRHVSCRTAPGLVAAKFRFPGNLLLKAFPGGRVERPAEKETHLCQSSRKTK